MLSDMHRKLMAAVRSQQGNEPDKEIEPRGDFLIFQKLSSSLLLPWSDLDFTKIDFLKLVRKNLGKFKPNPVLKYLIKLH
jgi:hypothetical protein